MKNFKTLFLILLTLCFFIPAILFAQMTWTCATQSAQWAPRSCNTLVAFHNTMWLMGGVRLYPDTVQYNDVWKSADGVSWLLATDSAEWPTRDCHASVVFHDTIWLTGGLIGGAIGGTYSDVWCSANGADWNCALDSAPWGPRCGHPLVVFHDTLWLVGGGWWNGSTIVPLKDVWKSGDGINWFQVIEYAPWDARAGHTMVVFRDTMWLMGGADWAGLYYSDVWKTGDGVNWTCVNNRAQWDWRYFHGSVVLDDKMWVMGGWALFPQGTNDVWYSTYGDSWIQATASAEWKPRGHVTAVVHDSKMWVMAGDTSAGLYTGSNDVWYSTGLGIEEHPMPNAECVTPNATIVCGVLNLQSAIYNLKFEITLLDITGRRVMNLHAGANNIRYLAPGVYFIRRENNSQVTKIIVTR